VEKSEHRSEARIIARGGEPATAPRRLLFVTGTPSSVLDGSGTYVGISVLRRALEDAGHRVDLVAPSHRSPATLRRLIFNVGARRAARGRDLDAIVGFDLDGLFVSSKGARRVASNKGVIADELQFERGFTRRSLRVASWLERIHVRRSDVVLTTSAYSASRIADEYGADRSRIRIVPEPIELSRWRSALAAAPARPRGSETVVLTVAHLYPRKGIAKLLRAILLLRTPAKLRIVGIGPERQDLEHLARDIGLGDRVAFLGHLPFDRLVKEYRGADVFCLPSLQEGFGIVFLEAMAAGLPIVACQTAAVPEVVPDLECGLLVPPDDVPALAFALERLAGDPAERTRMGEAGQRRVARYDAPVVAEKFLSAIGI